MRGLAARRGVLAAGLGLAAGRVAGVRAADAGADADGFPSRPVVIVVPYPVQGASDLVARILAPALAEVWQQPVRIENRAGTSGLVGAGYVGRAAPDGHVLLMGSLGALAIVPSLPGVSVRDPLPDLAPVAMVADLPMVLVTPTSTGIQSVTELVALARARPGAMSYGSSGAGHPRHVAAELFRQATQTRIRHVPLRGGGPVLADLHAGRIEMAFLMLIEAEEGLRQGWLRPLALSGPVRLPRLPGVPTLAETVAPGFEMSNWIGLLAPAGTAPSRVARLGSGVREALARPEVAGRLVEAGAVPHPSSPAGFAELIATERTHFAALVRRRGIRAD